MKKVILLTGATDGIGFATAKKLLDMGHHILLHGRNTNKLSATAETLQAETNPTISKYRNLCSRLILP